MSNPMRGSEIVPLLEKKYCIKEVSPTLRGKDPISNKVVTVFDLGKKLNAVYYGDAITWDIIELTNLLWGGSSNTQAKYSTLSDGWTYRYDMFNGYFEVLDSTGSIVERKKTDRLADFGISYEVITSHQFYIFYKLTLDRVDWFIPANPTKNREAGTTDEYGIMFVDKYHNADIFELNNSSIHGYEIRLITTAFTTFVLSNELSQCIVDVPEKVTILRPHMILRQQRGDYSAFATDTDLCFEATPRKLRAAHKFIGYTILLSAVLDTINRRGDCVIEPFMLWEMWKWLGAGIPELDEERIFDLSPNWSN